MNKKDIASIRKQFKPDNEYMNIREVFNVYVQKETGDIFHHVSTPFEMLERETQDLFYDNFKKVLTGRVNEKLFPLKFNREIEENTQHLLFQSLKTTDSEGWQEQMLSLVERMSETIVYDFDTVVTFIRGEYRAPTSKRNLESNEGGNDQVYANPFILCSVNQTTFPQPALVFDYIEKEFKAHSDVDPVINLKKPLSGFLYPTFEDHAPNVNHVLYSAKKANEPDERFIEDILHCTEATTAMEEKDGFELIVSRVADDKVDSTMLSNIYEEIGTILQANEEEEEEESPVLDYHDVEHILTTSGIEGVDTEKVKDSFQTILQNEAHQFKAESLLPKKVKIKTEVATISLPPQFLKNMKYINHEGRKCLLLEVNEGIEVEGFQLEELK